MTKLEASEGSKLHIINGKKIPQS